MTEIQMTDENRPYIEALMRMTLGMRDRDAEQVLLDAIQDLLTLRAKQAQLATRLIEIIREYRAFRKDASTPIGALVSLVGVEAMEQVVSALDAQLRVERLEREAHVADADADADADANGVHARRAVRMLNIEALDEHGTRYPIYVGPRGPQPVNRLGPNDPPIDPDTLNEPEPPCAVDEAQHTWAALSGYHVLTGYDETRTPTVREVHVAHCRQCGAYWRHL